MLKYQQISVLETLFLEDPSWSSETIGMFNQLLLKLSTFGQNLIFLQQLLPSNLSFPPKKCTNGAMTESRSPGRWEKCTPLKENLTTTLWLKKFLISNLKKSLSRDANILGDLTFSLKMDAQNRIPSEEKKKKKDKQYLENLLSTIVVTKSTECLTCNLSLLLTSFLQNSRQLVEDWIIHATESCINTSFHSIDWRSAKRNQGILTLLSIFC